MKDTLIRLFRHEVLTKEEACSLMMGITAGKYNDAQIAALLTVYQMRTISVDELLGFRAALMETRIPVDFDGVKVIDIVGTGGDGKDTFNISTCACFVVAGAGYKVAKHGNYGATSISGASNVMEQHGTRFTNNVDLLKHSLDVCGMVYMHAPIFNTAMKAVAPTRKALQFRTIFNLFGPLINPCRPDYQLLGVADLAQMRLYKNALQQLGVGFVVVNSLDGYDEISLTSEFKVVSNDYESIFKPADFGLETAKFEELRAGSTAQQAAQIFDNVLLDRATPTQKNVVLANAAFAIQAMEPQKSVEDCLAIARESLESGKAWATLQKFLDLNS